MAEDFAKRFKRLCQSRKVTQQQIALALHIDKSTISRYINGVIFFEDDLLERTCKQIFKFTETQTQQFIAEYRIFWNQVHGEQEKASSDVSFPVKIPLQRPPQVPNFTGREAEIKQILNDLQPGQVVTLSGPGGVGKTALALEVIWTLAPGEKPPERFPDGIIFHNFYKETQADIVLEKIARRFDEEPSPTPAAAAQRVLERKRALLVLDGTESADDLAKILEVRGSKCGVLITTTNAHDAEGILRIVEALPPKKAQRVLRAWSKRKTTNQKIAEEICTLVGYLPLALRIAGEFMVQRQMSASEYLALLKETELPALHLTERKHKSVPLLLKKSITPLGDAAQKALAAAALLASAPFDLKVIAAAIEIPEIEVRYLLSELINYSLIERVGQQYQFVHRLIHIYVRQMVTPPNEGLTRLAKYYTKLAKEQSTKAPEAYAGLDAEQVHIMAILTSCYNEKEWVLIRELVSVINEYLNMHSHWTECIAALQFGLTAARALEDVRNEAKFLDKLGEIYYKQGSLDEAIRTCHKSLELCKYLSDNDFESEIYNHLAEAYRLRGNLDEAIEHAKKAIRICQELGDRSGEAKSLTILGNIYADQGIWSEAVAMYDAGLHIRQILDDSYGEAIIFNNLALIYGYQGRWNQAVQYFEQALVIVQKLGNLEIEDGVLTNLADIYTDQGNWSKAIKLYEKSLQITRKMNNRGSEAKTLNNLGIVYVHQGRWTEAIAVCEASLAIKRELHDRPGEGHSLCILGRVYAEQSDFSKATQAIEESLEIAQKLNDHHSKARSLLNFGHILTTQNDWDNAIQKYNESLVIFRQLSDRYGEGSSLMGLGTAYFYQGRLDEAEAQYQKSLFTFRALGAHHDEGVAMIRIGFLKEKQGQKEEAVSYWQEALIKLNPDSPSYKQAASQLIK